MKKVKGKVWKYADDINTDVIFPGKYTYTISNPEEMAKHALEDLDPSFVENVRKGDIIVAGKNFGCGSSREQAATCIKYAGISAIVAKSFSRIFFRNAINQGLLVIQCEEAVSAISNGEELEINFEKGELYCIKGTFHFSPLPDFILEILRDGGLIPHVRKSISKG